MAITAEIYLQCDRCAARIFVSTGSRLHKSGDSIKRTRTEAAAAGWLIQQKPGGGDFCPKCAPDHERALRSGALIHYRHRATRRGT